MLGPLLFFICINDLPNSSKLLKFFSFADDTNIYFEADDHTGIIRNVNKELKKVKDWMDCTKLALNTEKQILYFSIHPKENKGFDSSKIRQRKYKKSQVLEVP